MLRCILVASALTASALHSPSLEEVEASEEVETEQDEVLDVDESADSLAEVAGDEDVDDDLDGDDDDDDDLALDDLDDDVSGDDDVDDDDDVDVDVDDTLDLDSDDDDDLDSLAEENGKIGEDPVDDDDEDDDDDDEDDDADDDADDDDKDENAEGKSPTMLSEAAEEGAESREFEFVADMPLETGPTDQASVFAKSKAAGKPAMVLATKSWCPHCKDLAESMNTDPAMKSLMSKFVAFHAPDAQGDAWHGDIGYVPRAFFYNKDGQQIDVHSPYAQYPYFFDSSQVLQAGMQNALSQAS